jgi:hypothetical protein
MMTIKKREYLIWQKVTTKIKKREYLIWQKVTTKIT